MNCLQCYLCTDFAVSPRKMLNGDAALQEANNAFLHYPFRIETTDPQALSITQ